MDTQQIMRDAQLAARNYDQLTSTQMDGRYLQASRMVRAIHQLAANGVGEPGRVTLTWVSDDTEPCVMCAWPEDSVAVLRIGDLAVCQVHIWRGLLAKLGQHQRGDIGYPAEQTA